VVNWFYENRNLHSFNLSSLYAIIGISRQGFGAYRKRHQNSQEQEDEIIERVKKLRVEHPRMGARPLYQMMMVIPDDRILLEKTGSNKFEVLVLSSGLGVKKVRNFTKTTRSGAFRFPNLILDLKIKELNHVWVSDITYFYCPVLNRFYYLTSILDVYPRRCLGLSWSATLKTKDTTIPALKMALKNRKINRYEKLIFHSDGGAQYYDQRFVKLLGKYNIKSSMGKSVYENPFAEKFNDILKNNYLIPWHTDSTDLPKAIKRFLRNYNSQKPHENLGGLNPMAFETLIQSLPLCQRTPLLLKDPDKE
jgi:putative transposase